MSTIPDMTPPTGAVLSPQVNRVLNLALKALEAVTENEEDRHQCCRFCEAESLPVNPGDENTDYEVDHDADCPIWLCDCAVGAIYRLKDK